MLEGFEAEDGHTLRNMLVDSFASAMENYGLSMESDVPIRTCACMRLSFS